MSGAREQVDTLVVGAGPSGLAVGGAMRARGLSCVIIDAADAVGASWRTHYARLHLHTTKAYSSLPGLPMPDAYPTYPSRQQVVDYLERYAAHFDLRPRLGVRVTRAARVGERWQVDTRAGHDRGDGTRPEAGFSARHLVVATGYNRAPFIPDLPGLESFEGEVVHSARYGDGARFAGKDVLVVGAGNSGAEIAIDLWEHGARPQLVVRSPIHVVPREIFGVPSQHNVVRLRRLPPRVVDRLTLPLIEAIIGDLTTWGVRRPAIGPLEQVAREGRVPLIDVGTVALIKQGAVGVRPGVRALGPRDVTFADGACASFDAIVMATGYRARLGDFLEGAESVTDARGYPTTHGRETIIPGLYFCGFRNPHTGALRESAIEARRVADAIARAPRAGRHLRGRRSAWSRVRPASWLRSPARG